MPLVYKSRISLIARQSVTQILVFRARAQPRAVLVLVIDEFSITSPKRWRELKNSMENLLAFFLVYDR